MMTTTAPAAPASKANGKSKRSFPNSLESFNSLTHFTRCTRARTFCSFNSVWQCYCIFYRFSFWFISRATTTTAKFHAIRARTLRLKCVPQTLCLFRKIWEETAKTLLECITLANRALFFRFLVLFCRHLFDANKPIFNQAFQFHFQFQFQLHNQTIQSLCLCVCVSGFCSSDAACCYRTAIGIVMVSTSKMHK